MPFVIYIIRVCAMWCVLMEMCCQVLCIAQDANGHTALHDSCQNGHYEVRLLFFILKDGMS